MKPTPSIAFILLIVTSTACVSKSVLLTETDRRQSCEAQLQDTRDELRTCRNESEDLLGEKSRLLEINDNLLEDNAGLLSEKNELSTTLDHSRQELNKLKEGYVLTKNDRLHKYEYKKEGIDVDIYVPHYSELAIPCEDLVGMCSVVEGIKTVDPEPLLVLKQAAELERRGTVKGEKDVIDIVSLLASDSLDFKKYAEVLKKYGLENYRGELKGLLLRSAEALGTFYKNPAKVKKKRREWIEQLDMEWSKACKEK